MQKAAHEPADMKQSLGMLCPGACVSPVCVAAIRSKEGLAKYASSLAAAAEGAETV